MRTTCSKTLVTAMYSSVANSHRSPCAVSYSSDKCVENDNIDITQSTYLAAPAWCAFGTQWSLCVYRLEPQCQPPTNASGEERKEEDEEALKGTVPDRRALARWAHYLVRRTWWACADAWQSPACRTNAQIYPTPNYHHHTHTTTQNNTLLIVCHTYFFFKIVERFLKSNQQKKKQQLLF